MLGISLNLDIFHVGMLASALYLSFYLLDYVGHFSKPRYIPCRNACQCSMFIILPTFP